MIKLKINWLCLLPLSFFFTACGEETASNKNEATSEVEKIVPILKTAPVAHDSDDPAIWVNYDEPEASLILGTDKEVGGGLMVFNLKGDLLDSLSVTGLFYPNNVDVQQGVRLSDSLTMDIAVVTEREKNRIRIFSLPDMKAIDQGGIPVFVKDSLPYRRPMGVSLYKDQKGNCSAIVSRKEGPTKDYLEQWALNFDSTQQIQATLLRSFGEFSGGEGEIEAILVDDEYGFVYYSDEAYGLRKYHADPEKGNTEILTFGKEGFAEDREGIALWPLSDTSGWIIVSNQQDLSFNVYNRNEPHEMITNWKLSTVETDGCDLYQGYLNSTFPEGVFVAMSEDSTFHFYDLKQLNTKPQ